MRCFVAIELTPTMRAPLLQLLRSFPRSPEVRWVTEDQLHVTLKFLGEVAAERLPAVQTAVTTASTQVAPFEISLGKLGCFPSPHNPRVLWCGLTDAGANAARWVELADPLFGELGFDREGRAYTPHITLGRSKGPAGGAAIRQVLAGAVAPRETWMTVDHVILFESRLRPQGPTYLPIQTAPLGPSRGRP